MGCAIKKNVYSYKDIKIPQALKLTNEQRDSVMMEVIKTLMTSGIPNMNIYMACGIAGNIKAESEFNYTLLGDDGTSYGLCQWHFNRLENLYNYCKQIGEGFDTPRGQIKFLVYELNSTEKKALNEIIKPGVYNDIDKVAEKFCQEFERPSEDDVKCPKRAKLAREVYEKFNKLKSQS